MFLNKITSENRPIIVQSEVMLQTVQNFTFPGHLPRNQDRSVSGDIVA